MMAAQHASAHEAREQETQGHRSTAMGPEMAAEDAPSRAEIHLLDMGREEYGDATLCRFGRTTVLIDGGHRHDDHPADGHTPLQEQIGTLLGRSAPPYTVDLLVVTHAHEDHIGCLPA